MDNSQPHDIRLVYMAISWLLTHRGHFLNEVDKQNVDKLIDFNDVYLNLMQCFETAPWSCNAMEFKKVLTTKCGIGKKEKLFKDLLYDGKSPVISEDDTYDISILIKLISGSKVSPVKLFPRGEYSEVPSFSLNSPDDEFASILSLLGDDAMIVEKMRALYDCALLTDILSGEKTISHGKVKVYEQHRSDLSNLKRFIKKYLPTKYNEVFRNAAIDNYVAYSGNEKSLTSGNRIAKKATKEVFCDYIRKEIKSVEPEECDKLFYDDMINRLEAYTFMPKQVNGENRVIPYQLYWNELNKILQNARVYLSFLNDTDNGINNVDKILSIFEFKIPYYVGPLRKDNSQFAWIERKAEGKIYPWNFEEKVDLDASEEAFINRLTCTCTYLPGKDVLPKNSLLYCKFTILNEINNIKVNGRPITVEAKQAIFSLFEQRLRVSIKAIRECLICNGYINKNDVISGLDDTIKSSYKPYHDFKRFIINGILTDIQIEDIIKHITYSEEKIRIRKYLEKTYSNLSKDDIKYITNLKYADFGRLSRELLTEINAVDCSTGEYANVITFLWGSNDNLMQILSDSNKYTFADEIEKIRKEYYSLHPRNLEALLDDMYISNAVKRPIYRTLDVVKEVKKVMGCDPTKIFVEMARGGGEKGVRTKSRRDQISELYKHVNKDEVRLLSEQLEGKSDNELQSEVLFLYFMQLGKCMYTGNTLDISKLKTKDYDVDHIYPQSKVKDDSINNKVLVYTTANGTKGDKYPVNAEWQQKMYPFWKMLSEKGLVSEEKFRRLTRTTTFTEEELQGFINRQLVETRQSTKAVATIFEDMFPDTEVVYVKAGLVSDFKKEFDIVKSRSINDLHHAKDAYLNIVCGNVYNSKFTKKFFSVKSEYSIKTKTIYTHSVVIGNETVWEGENSLVKVKSVVSKNNIHFTRFAFMRKGGFFDQMPVKASEGLVERKSGLDTSKYGGYNKSTATCFILARYMVKGKPEVVILPIELLYADKFFKDNAFAQQYISDAISKYESKPFSNVSLPLGYRPIKVNTVFSFDGYRSCLKAKTGVQLLMASLMSLKLSVDTEMYIKKLENYKKKAETNKAYKIQEKYDKITAEENIVLYDLFTEKLKSKPFVNVVFSNQYSTLVDGRDKFVSLSLEEQTIVLLNILLLFKTCRSGVVDLSDIGGKKKVGGYFLSSKLSNWKKCYSDVRIIDTSAAGLFETKTDNLLELI